MKKILRKIMVIAIIFLAGQQILFAQSDSLHKYELKINKKKLFINAYTDDGVYKGILRGVGDSSIIKNQSEFVSKVKLPVRLFSTYSLNKFTGINPAQNNIPGSSIIYQEMQRQNVSGTILQVLGIACLTVFGDRTNHPYQFRNH